MTLNKQGKNVSFEIRDFELNKKGEKYVKYSDEAYYIKKKNGYILCAIDGSKIEIPNTPLNREIFGSEGNQHKMWK